MFSVRKSIEDLIDPAFLFPALTLHALSLFLLDPSELLTQLLVEIDHKLAKAVLLFVSDAFVVSVLDLDGSLCLSEMPEVRL